MKSISFLIFTIGIVCIVMGYTEMKMSHTNKPIIEYRFIPRNIYDEQFVPTNLKNNFSDMFDKLEPSSFNINN